MRTKRVTSQKRKLHPDPVYGDVMISRVINKLMMGGKRSIAERIMYEALSIVKEKTKKDPKQVFEKALNTIMPEMEVRSHRVGGATYQVPVDVRPDRKISLGIRWLVEYARDRHEKSMAERLANEIMDADKGQGNAVKKKEDTHRMADANKAFAHFRW
jgi:small subunit ribosomal protein S7